jgi:hypothetical protein
MPTEHLMATEHLDAGAAWEAVRHRRRWLLLAGAAGLVLGTGWAVLRPPLSVASSEVMFSDDPNDPKRADTEVQIARSRAVLDLVRTGMPAAAAAALPTALSASKVTHDVIRLTAQADSPAHARALADRYTDGYIDYSGGILRQAAANEAGALNRQLDPVNAAVATTADRLNRLDSDPLLNATGPQGEAARLEQASLQKSQDQLSQDIADLRSKLAAQQVGAGRHDYLTQVNRAAPIAPTRKSWLRRVAVPTVLLPGLVAVGIVVARRRDMRLYTADQVAAAAGAPVSATVAAPADTARATDPRPTGTLEPGEILRYRRALLRLLGTDRTEQPVPALTMVRPAADHAARWAAEQLSGLLPAGAPPVRQVAAAGSALPDLEANSRLVLVVSAGTLSAAALHNLAAACRDAGVAPHAVLLVRPTQPAPALRPLRLRRAEPVGSTAL